MSGSWNASTRSWRPEVCAPVVEDFHSQLLAEDVVARVVVAINAPLFSSRADRVVRSLVDRVS